MSTTTSSAPSKEWEDLNMTGEEMDRMCDALKSKEFKKLLFDYCNEIHDPENRKLFEAEMTQLEKERGVEVTFLHTEPGFVVKTSVNGKTKGFINIARCEKIAKPISEVRISDDTNQPGLSWSIPYAQAPPRNDYDNRGVKCLVYDVIFHPDALHLAEKNSTFRKNVISTACDAVEREFHVQLDRTNLKFPKLKFKGVAKPTVIRKKINGATLEPSPIDEIYPPPPSSETTESSTVKRAANDRETKEVDLYATPSYVIKHQRSLDMSEMTNELDAKLNITVPKALSVEIDLPMLNSTSDCTLDVTNRKLYLVSETPAKYKLSLELPYPVDDKKGSAKFDRSTKRLMVLLPVCSEKERHLKDIYREDSGVESDVRDSESQNSLVLHKNVPLIEVLNENSTTCDEPQRNLNKTDDNDKFCETTKFLKDSIEYNFPNNFDCNTLDENLAFTLHVKNVIPDSLTEIFNQKSSHVQFSTIGSGYYPIFYAFYVELPAESTATIENVDMEVWDNNVIFTLTLNNYAGLKSYAAGLHSNDVKVYPIIEDFVAASKKFVKFTKEKRPPNDIKIAVKPCDSSSIEIAIKSVKQSHSVEEDSSSDNNSEKLQTGMDDQHEANGQAHKDSSKKCNKRHKKKTVGKKQRSMSESFCDDFINSMAKYDEITKEENVSNASNAGKISSPARKIRSASECHSYGGSFKGILKQRSRYCRSVSESCSSFDGDSYSCSMDYPGMDGGIPEEEDFGSQQMSESCKKHVRFSENIRKQLYRTDSSILGQRKKNQKKKNAKQRALQRRNSEGDSADYDDKSPNSDSFLQNKVRKGSQNDSGLDLSSDGGECDKLNARKDFNKNSNNSSNDLDFKNPLIFDLEI